MMEARQPMEVKAHHLARRAIVYVRQSTGAQVATNRGSTDYQRGQRRHAEALGWASDQIEINEVDLGLTGAAAEHRQGYQEMLAAIGRGEIGAVFVSDDSRLGREPVAALAFANQCLEHDVLLVVDGRIDDLADRGKLFLNRLHAALGEFENLRRRDQVVRGIDARLAAGKAVTAPPVGYVRTADGDWDLDPDTDVQGALCAVFRLFVEKRSCARTVRALLHLGVRVPRRRPGRPVHWAAPNVGNVRAILKNIRYTGRYCYRERVCDPRRGRDGRGNLRLRPAHADETIVIEDHHPPYVSFADWTEIQAILRTNAPTAARRNLGPGSALLQGLMRCGAHPQRAMTVGYKAARRDGGQAHYYRCLGDYPTGGRQCRPTSGCGLDAAVVEAALARIAAPRLAALRPALEEAVRAERDEQGLQARELMHARQQAADLRFRYLAVNPANRLVKEDLEVQFEEAARRVKALEAGRFSEASGKISLSAQALDELISLCADLPALYWAPTTCHRDRKEILRLLISEVVVTAKTPEQLSVTVVWADGSPASRLTIPTFRDAHRRIARLGAEDRSLAEIVQHLNEAALCTQKGRPWSKNAVRSVLKALARLPRAGGRVE